MIEVFFDTFNNREISVLFWLLVATILILRSKTFRPSLASVFKAFIQHQVLLGLIGMTTYAIALVSLLSYINFWNLSFIKDTFYWYIGVALIMLINVTDAGKNKNFFVDIIRRNLNLMLILEFILNFYSFSLITELLLLPIITFMILMKSVGEHRIEHQKVARVLGVIISLIGYAILAVTIFKTLNNYNLLITSQNLKILLLPPVLTIGLLPFIYLLALYIEYEIIFLRINAIKNTNEMRTYAKRYALRYFNVKLQRIIEWKKTPQKLMFQNCADVHRVFKIDNNLK